jgi:gag-polypeptide of LTR copia-type
VTTRQTRHPDRPRLERDLDPDQTQTSQTPLLDMSQPPIFLLAFDEKFDGTNWVEWKGTILSAADARGLNGYLDGTITKPPDPSPGQAAPTATA